MSVTALDRLSRLRIRASHVGQQAARLILFLCAVHFIFWYGLHFSRNEALYLGLTPYESWDAINHDDGQGRIAINAQLAQASGKQLVFVRYYLSHKFDEWVYNRADIDAARIVWARDLGAVENEKLLGYYPDRAVWLLEPDFRPPRLTPYRASR